MKTCIKDQVCLSCSTAAALQKLLQPTCMAIVMVSFGEALITQCAVCADSVS
ncbi:Protein of unknown function [Pyronema omphalodes CBS 100304]|uniref:Uncharacterized protein n=1 Tax=Pyronema omphalodes (strain CBS 100304) TaxID=1076935 RepID=U4KZ43_PYROM|nr:Protein of unknown function [Pyronema omphalodes CBS 100304]